MSLGKILVDSQECERKTHGGCHGQTPRQMETVEGNSLCQMDPLTIDWKRGGVKEEEENGRQMIWFSLLDFILKD